MNLHLSDAQRDQFAATGLIVVEGVDDNFPGKFDPVGDWRDLDQPCDTCRGEGHLSRVVGQDPEGIDCYEQRACPDCVGGRRVVTLTATCPKCNGRGEKFVNHVNTDGWLGARCYGCPRDPADPRFYDTGSGVVTLGRFTIPALLPVYGQGHHEGEWVAIVSGEALHIRNGRLVGPLPLDPLPRPGQFIARPERV